MVGADGARETGATSWLTHFLDHIYDAMPMLGDSGHDPEREDTRPLRSWFRVHWQRYTFPAPPRASVSYS